MMTISNGDENREIGGGMQNDEGGVAEYEMSREQRIKQNLQKMHKLGILDLSRNLKPPTKPKIRSVRPQKPSPVSSSSRRRSFRLRKMPAVIYEKKYNPKPKLMMDVKIEVYTEDHVKMLGDHIENWKHLVNGDDDEMKHTYCPYAGKRCHQCRRKIAGIRSNCCKCKTGQKLYCSICLFKRYGENVLEVSANPDWVCPVCRDICNCSCCRRAKGWEPVGNFYPRALHLGFKSVAHYLIHTYGPHRKQDNLTSKELVIDDILIEKNIKHHDLDQQFNFLDVVDDDEEKSVVDT